MRKAMWIPLLALAVANCSGGGETPESIPLSRPVIDRHYLVDQQGRYLSLHGVNVSGSTKVPAFIQVDGDWRKFATEDLTRSPTTYKASFVGRPFAVDEGWKPGDGIETMGFENVRNEIRKLRNVGFDSFRLMVQWEGIEPLRKGVYDQEYLHYVQKIVEISNEFGVYVLLDFHQDMVSRYLAAKFNDRPTFLLDDGTEVAADPWGVESMVLALFPPYTDSVRGDQMPKWAVQTALPEKDMRPGNPWWGTPRIVSQFSPALLCNAYSIYELVSGDEPDELIGFACSTIDPESPFYDPIDGRDSVCNAVANLSDEDLDPWIKHIARHACNTDNPLGVPGSDPVFAPNQTVGMLPFTTWSWGYILSLDVQRTAAAFFGSDTVFPGMYVRLCNDGRENPHDVFDCPPERIEWPTHDVCRDKDTPTWKMVGCTDVRKEFWSVKDYLQDSYAESWVQVVNRVKDLPNVIGYDIINEPVGYGIMLALAQLVQMAGVDDGMIFDVVNGIAGDPILARTITTVATSLGLVPAMPPLPAEPVLPTRPVAPVPPGEGASQEDQDLYLVEQGIYRIALREYDQKKTAYDADMVDYEQRKAAAEAARDAIRDVWGLQWKSPNNAEPSLVTEWDVVNTPDLFGLIDYNTSFDYSFLRPFFTRIGTRILEVDPDAILYIEGSMSLGSVGRDLGMPTPDGLEGRVVFAPHHYEDIYPFLGFNVPPRDFKIEEIEHRDYTEGMKAAALLSQRSLGNAPVVYGEFGSYFNFNGIDTSIDNDYLITAHVLDNFYEGFESLFASRMVWCYSPDNDKRFGDLWNKEDFSIQGFDGNWRAERAWARPHARALAGKPLYTHFRSPYSYFDPDKGVPDPVGEFVVRYAAKETHIPTEISIPYDIQYPDGFYVWVSDGMCYYDHEKRTLYHLPSVDDPGTEHWVRIMPPLDGRPNTGWKYFFRGDQVVTGSN